MKSLYSLLLFTGLSLAATVDSTQIEAKIRQAVNERYGNIYARMEVILLNRSKSLVGNTADELRVSLPEKSLGLTLVPVTLISEKGSRQVQVQTLIKAYDRVLVTRQSVNRLQSLSDSCVKISEEEVTSYVLAGKETCKAPEQIYGKRSKSFLKPGEMLTADMLEPVPDVLKDQVLSLIVEKENLSVKLTVKAITEGFIGNTIQVLNPKSNTVLLARISDKQGVVLAN